MKISKPKHNKHKSDAFSLGLVLLEAGLLKSIQGIYDKKKGTILQNELNILIEEFSNKYMRDYDLVQALRSMLVVSEFDRSGFTELKMQFAANTNIVDLAKSNDFQDFNFVDRRTSHVSASRNHNPMNSALGTNKATNPIFKKKGRYGTNYMNFDDGNDELRYWEEGKNVTPVRHQSSKAVSNPLTRGLLNQNKYSGYKPHGNAVGKTRNAAPFDHRQNPQLKRAQNTHDIRNPLSDYKGFSNRNQRTPMKPTI